MRRVLGIAIVAALAANVMVADSAHAVALFTPVWTNLNTGYDATSLGYNPVDDVVSVGDAFTGTPATHAYDAATGALLPPTPPVELPTAGLTLDGSLGFFGGIAGSANGGYYGLVSNGTNVPGNLKVWPSLTGAAAEVPFNGSFSRNMFMVGARMYSTGSADGGPLEVLEPDAGTGDYNVVHTMGPAGPGTAGPGGKSGVTATQDGSTVWGIEGLNLPGLNTVNKFTFDGTNYNYEGSFDPQTLLPGRAIDVAIDEDDNLMFLIDFDNDKVWALRMKTAAVGDEKVIDSFDIGVDTTFYMGLEIDPVNNHLYWGARTNGGGDFNFGKLSYVPEPTSLALLAMGSLAMLRRRR
ncbi:MAG: PEP-CTERM sorting domain-containing protein [bacterium]|nr:PEP-CTERM sorting domain-containing protein [bacterium]